MQPNSVALPVLSDLQKVCNYFSYFLHITIKRIFSILMFRSIFFKPVFQVRRFLSTVLPIVRSFQKVTTMKNVLFESLYLTIVYLLSRHKSFAGLPPFLVFSLPSLSSTLVLQCSLCCLLYFLYGSR